MSEVIRTASFSRNHGSFYRAGVFEPEEFFIPQEVRRCACCGVRMAQLNGGNLCYRHQEIERRQRLERLASMPPTWSSAVRSGEGNLASGRPKRTKMQTGETV